MRTISELQKVFANSAPGKVISVTQEELGVLLFPEHKYSKNLIKEAWDLGRNCNSLDGGGVKHDQDKPRMDLLDNHFLLGLSSVLTFGAKKYAAHNWRKGISVSRLVAAAYRHLGAFNSGEDNDPESGIAHLFHAACCIMFASWMMTFRKDMDDRYHTTHQYLNANKTEKEQ